MARRAMRLTQDHWLLIDAIIAAHPSLTLAELSRKIPAFLKGGDKAKSLLADLNELIDAGVVYLPRDENRVVMRIDLLQQLALLAENPSKNEHIF